MCVDAKSTIYISPPYERTSVITTLQRVLAVFPHNRMHIPEIAVSSQQMNLTPNQRLCILVVHFSPSIHTHSCIGTYVSNTPREDITIVDLALVRHASGWRTLNTLQLLLVVTKLCVRAGAQSRPCAARRERPARSHHPPRRTPRTSASQGIRVRCRQGGWIQYR